MVNGKKSIDLCKDCTLCCEYFNITIDAPKNKDDRDAIRWYLLHNAIVYIDHEDDWMVQVEQRCKALGEEGLCKIYKTRPLICRRYSQEGCERYGTDTWYKHLFTTPEEFDAYIASATKNGRIAKNLNTPPAKDTP